MEFIQAVRNMKEGKKVRRDRWDNKDWHIFNKIHAENVFELVGADNKSVTFSLRDFEATDWEVVEEDWNLAKCSGDTVFEVTCPNCSSRCKDTFEGYLDVTEAKKCRDLILKDLNIEWNGVISKKIPEIINRRFGDLG